MVLDQDPQSCSPLSLTVKIRKRSGKGGVFPAQNLLPRILPRGAHALAAFESMTTLNGLELNLRKNHVTPDGIQAVATLRESRSLRHLSLNLARSDVADAGAQSLAALQKAPRLQALTVDLTYSRVSDTGAKSIAAAMASSLQVAFPFLSS